MNHLSLAVFVISIVLLILLYINYRIFRFRTFEKLKLQNEKINLDKEKISELKEELEKYTSKSELLNSQLLESHLSDRALTNLHQQIAKFFDAVLHARDTLKSDNSMQLLVTYSRQLNNYIDVEKAEKSILEVKKETFELNDLVEKVIKKYELFLKKKNLNIKTDIKAGIKIFSDKYLFERILENYLDNAISFSLENGLISIYTELLNQEVKLHIMDEGPGIPSKHHVSVFNKYVTLGKYNVKGNITAGLGLAFCKMAVSLNGGVVGLDSGLNIGTDFWFTVEKVVG